ncbi:PEGA domain-containing protein [Maribrevibacterium harenarium]|uniref:PEGA domain-containing protein n=1 Tax=Maribrevibacterium harenarium TaxID=2589817 RepID=A0A501WD22_9GAMM|nr:PEGA domain-containing protein [Maribrevibacterium harenarium]TPE46722.1 PEGA domain-containing protein [Maribrevibacterium harenarium]
MSNSKIFITLFTAAVISGCASNQYSVTYASDPAGAQVYCNGEAEGYTPVTLYYTLDEETKNRGVLNTVPCRLNWVSGASAKANSQFSLSEFPNGVITTTRRPNEPNAHIDHSFALQLEQNRQMNQVLQNTQAIQAEQWRVKQQMQQEKNTQNLCNLGLLNHPGCR